MDILPQESIFLSGEFTRTEERRIQDSIYKPVFSAEKELQRGQKPGEAPIELPVPMIKLSRTEIFKRPGIRCEVTDFYGNAAEVYTMLENNQFDVINKEIDGLRPYVEKDNFNTTLDIRDYFQERITEINQKRAKKEA